MAFGDDRNSDETWVAGIRLYKSGEPDAICAMTSATVALRTSLEDRLEYRATYRDSSSTT